MGYAPTLYLTDSVAVEYFWRGTLAPFNFVYTGVKRKHLEGCQLRLRGDLRVIQALAGLMQLALVARVVDVVAEALVLRRVVQLLRVALLDS